jgi:hypothetical protein
VELHPHSPYAFMACKGTTSSLLPVLLTRPAMDRISSPFNTIYTLSIVIALNWAMFVTVHLIALFTQCILLTY